jgi:hypothetical protein
MKTIPLYLFVGIVVLGFSVAIPAIIGMIRRWKKPSQPLPLSKPESISPLPEEKSLKDQLEGLRDECSRKEKQFEAEILRTQEIGWIRDEERREALKQLEETKSQFAIFAHFDPLQLDALTFSKEILQYLKDFEPKPPRDTPGKQENRVQRYEWLQRLVSGYELRFGQRGRDLTLRFKEKGISVITGPEPNSFEDKVRQWADELVALAYKIDGITLHVGTLQ